MRNTSKALLLIVAVLLTWSLASATMVDNVVYIPKTMVPPEIDGEMDGVWYNTTEYFLQKYETPPPDDWFDLFSSWRMLWDEDNFYVFLYCQDYDVVDEHANAWEQDGFEVYFDANNLKSDTGYDDEDDVQIRINHGYAVPEDITFGFGNGGTDWGFIRDDIEFAVYDNPDGISWNLEVKIPMMTVNANLIEGDLFGFEVQNNENDGTARDCIAKWWEESNSTWTTPAVWGTCMLWDLEIDEMLPVVKVDPKDGFVPTLDGEMEAGWVRFPNFNCNTWVYDEGDYFDYEECCDDWTDHRVRFRLICDDNNMYCFTQFWDDIVIDEHTNAWERDGVEFYFDADNSDFEDVYDGANDVQIRINHDTVEPVTWGFGNGGSDWGIQAADVLDYAVADADYGFNIEWSLPMDDLQIDPDDGYEFGFEVQTNENDADARDSMRRWWWHTNSSWTNPIDFGTAVIVADPGPLAVEDASYASVPADFNLSQNYPNPFNPVTTINYTVERTGQVNLAVYNLLGEEVATLVDQVKPAGSHKVVFEAKDLTSGVYFYKLITENNVETRKMTLLK